MYQWQHHSILTILQAHHYLTCFCGVYSGFTITRRQTYRMDRMREIKWWVVYGAFEFIVMFTPIQVMGLVLSCPFLQEQSTDFYAYKLPIFILLIANSFFLVWIMVVSRFVII